MKKTSLTLVAITLVTSVLLGPYSSFAATNNPYARTVDIEQATSQTNITALTDEQKARDALKSYINSIGGEVQLLESAYGITGDDGNYISGSFDALKLKPSDKKRLIKLANGSLTDKEKREIAYDANLMGLLTRLTAPKELGGGGIKHLRVGDLLRFRRDPRSRETEAADNISQHQFGKAADILEINQTHCTEESLLGGSKDLPPFPVKVIWQGGAPYNPSSAILSTFDATARSNAMRDIIGTLPSDGYEGDNQTLDEILNRLQRRVIADELGLDRSSLDYLTDNDMLLTVGQAVTNDALGFPTGSLQGSTPEDVMRSLPQSYFEDSLRLPPGSFKGDTVQQAIENLGRVKAALDAGANIKDVLDGKVDEIKNSVFYSFYSRAEAAFGLPSGTLDGIKNNRKDAFAAIGAKLIAERLRYSLDETNKLIDQAKKGEVAQLSLARIGDISRTPLNILPMIAPTKESSKKAGEVALGKLILGQNSQTTLSKLPDYVGDTLKSKLGGLSDTSSRQTIGETFIDSKNRNATLRLVGASAMEEVFGLPTGSLVDTVAKHPNPTLEQFIPILGKKVNEFAQLPSGSDQSVGQTYVQTTLRESFNDFYHASPVGLAKISDKDIFSILVGPNGDANTRAGASWVEEDLGLAPESFSALFSAAPVTQRLESAGLSVVSGEIFDTFEIATEKIADGKAAVTAIGQAKIETVLGLRPGTFSGSVADLKKKNSDRFDRIFAKPSTVDALVGLDPGSTDKVLKDQMALDVAANQVGTKLLPALNTDTLENKFGWDSRYAINGQDLLAGLQNQTVGSGTKTRAPNSNEILATIGGYNTDFAFGWDPGTTAKLFNGATPAQNEFIVSQGSSGFAQTIGLNLKDPTDLLRAYREGTGAISVGESKGLYRPPVSSIITDAFKKRLNIPGVPEGEQVPSIDINSIINGDLPSTNYSIIAANQASQIKEKFDHAYQLYRILISGSGSDVNFEASLNKEGFERYQRVLADIAKTKFEDYKDQALERITNGVIDASGVLSFASSPYADTVLKGVELAYFSSKEARNEFFYGTLDAQMRKTDPDLPPDFTKTLMEGSNYDRSVMLFDYIDGKVTDAVLGQLPENLRPLAVSWLNNESIDAGTVLSSSPEFQAWMGSVFTSAAGINLPEPAISLLMQYATNTIDPTVFIENPSLVLSISPENMTGVIDTALGFVGGEFTEYYDKYRQIQSLYSDYQAGNLDAGQAIFAVDALLFDGKLAELTHSIDDALGLPGGSTQLLIQYAITGNPLYLAQFAFNLFFGSTIECPDLQQEAQKNVQLLIKEIINQGENTARFIPSQIITYQQSYLTTLRADIRKNYSVCLETKGARCGVFARPEYAKQVHIGF